MWSIEVDVDMNPAVTAYAVEKDHTGESAGLIAARIERIPFSSWHVNARLIVGMATFFDGFDALTIAQVLPVLAPLWKLSSPQVGALISTGYLGQLVGALLFGRMAEKWGRIPALTTAITIFSVMSILCGSAWNFQSLSFFRLIQGIGLGGEVPIGAVYISEITKAHGRGRFVLAFEAIFTFGIVAAGFIGSVVVPNLGWRYMFFLGAVPLAVAVVLPKLLPESPRWLASQSRFAEADAATSKIERSVEHATGKPLPKVSVGETAAVRRSSWRDLLGGRYLKRSIVVWTIWAVAYLIYYSLVAWLPTLYRTMFSLSLRDALHNGLILTVCSLFGCIACALAIDVFGRKLVFTTSLCGTGVSLLLLGLHGITSVRELVIGSGCAGFFIGASTVGVYLYTPELYPTRARALATSVASAWLRIASIVGPFVVGLHVATGISGLIVVFAAIALIAGVIVALFGTETKGRVLEDISP